MKIQPPYRVLDPALAVAEGLLATQLSTVVAALPDEHAAAASLNALLARSGASPRLHPAGDAWQVVHVATADRDSELVVAACGLATLVAAAGWRRVKNCDTCGAPFVDRTNGCTRRWCTRHRPRR